MGRTAADVPDEIVALMEAWDGERVVSSVDRETGAWMFVCVHRTVQGTSCGGTRMRVYESAAEALADGLQLSAAMTRKFAVAGFPVGGAKAVLAVPEIPRGEQRRRLLLSYAGLLNSLAGGFRTGPDMNISAADADVIREHSEYVFATSAGVRHGLSVAQATAVGVLEGIKASVEFALGQRELTGRTVLVQGVGAVGGALVELLNREGATVLVSDVDRERALLAARRIDARVVAPDAVLETDCDVFAPCAVGGMVGADSVNRLRCRVLAGSANNPLRDPATADALRAAGILYAPDFVISGGGVIHAFGAELGDWTSAQLFEHLRGIGTTLTAIYESAAARGVDTERAAHDFAEHCIAATRV
jgi:leucine dehydrogenase